MDLNVKQLLDNFKQIILPLNSITTFYSIIPRDKLKSRYASFCEQNIVFKNGKKRHEYIVVNYNSTHLSDAKHKCTEDDI